jgi:hypothetical protein
MSFQIGDRVRWLKEKPGFTGSVGIVVDVVSKDQHVSDFNLYDVKFDFGLLTVHGSELTLAPPTFSCKEREGLLLDLNKASEIYRRSVARLVDAVGTMAHVEFEFLRQKVADARHAAREAREQLNKHRVEHGC